MSVFPSFDAAFAGKLGATAYRVCTLIMTSKDPHADGAHIYRIYDNPTISALHGIFYRGLLGRQPDVWSDTSKMMVLNYIFHNESLCSSPWGVGSPWTGCDPISTPPPDYWLADRPRCTSSPNWVNTSLDPIRNHLREVMIQEMKAIDVNQPDMVSVRAHTRRRPGTASDGATVILTPQQRLEEKRSLAQTAHDELIEKNEESKKALQALEQAQQRYAKSITEAKEALEASKKHDAELQVLEEEVKQMILDKKRKELQKKKEAARKAFEAQMAALEQEQAELE